MGSCLCACPRTLGKTPGAVYYWGMCVLDRRKQPTSPPLITSPTKMQNALEIQPRTWEFPVLRSLQAPRLGRPCLTRHPPAPAPSGMYIYLLPPLRGPGMQKLQRTVGVGLDWSGGNLGTKISSQDPGPLWPYHYLNWFLLVRSCGRLPILLHSVEPGSWLSGSLGEEGCGQCWVQCSSQILPCPGGA